MSLEAIKAVTNAEQQAEEIRANAALQAKGLISDAEKQGKQIFEQARADARAAVKEMEVQVAQKSTAAAEKIAEATEASCQRLRTVAETKMDAAVGIIVGRIVNGA